MKKSTLWALAIAIVVILAIVWFGRSPTGPEGISSTTGNTNTTVGTTGNTNASVNVPVTETTKISSKTSKYENAELGFSVNYPSTWEADNTNSGVNFTIPFDKSQVSTVATLQADVNILSATCAFPAVVTIKDRGTITVAGLKANMISMSNTVQNRAYFNRMYSLQKGEICYMFKFSSITSSPESKGLTGSNLTQAQNNNKAITTTADTDFTNMVKSFAFVTAAVGQDETKVSPVKK